ncbi:MAG: sigma-70 family RNA polymerase sigma factor [Sphingomonadales bacterium]|nr:MAG: sigma-70 family RNA polymerase sigma factor [Sphingomonadales bacterium]TNF05029.1 MAG: sigma-70 family RNA polymerase sigma factor [Sphingomonadales bacterium]
MSKTTELLEAAVAEVIANHPAEGEQPTARQRAATDRAFAMVMKIIAPRIRHFIRQYGLMHYREDAEQVCAIGVHRAIEAYDPARAMFTTFVNWQIRGELQGLRFRLMDDQRPSAKKVDAVTISLHGKDYGPDGEEISLETMIEDENATARTENRAADHMAGQISRALLDEYVRHLRDVGIAQLRRKALSARKVTRRQDISDGLPRYVQSHSDQVDPEELRKLEDRIRRDRDIVCRHLFDLDGEEGRDAEMGLTRERIRQITRRAAKLIGELASENPRFAIVRPHREGEELPAPPLLPQGRNRGADPATTRVTEPDHAPVAPDHPGLTILFTGVPTASRH